MKRIVVGRRAVVEALKGRGAATIAVVYLDEALGKAAEEIVSLARQHNVRAEERAGDAIERLAEGEKHQGVVAIAGEYPYVSMEEIVERAAPSPLLVALDQITDPHNVGAIVRSAVAFGADGVLLLKDRAAPVTPVVVRASAGATEHARIARVTNLARALDQLREGGGLEVVGLAGEGTVNVDALAFAPAGRVIVIGAESRGMRRLTRERCDTLVRIEITDAIDSLNASVAAGIALHAAARARAAAR